MPPRWAGHRSCWLVGRPTKLTPEVQERIVKAIGLGATYEHAALAGGVCYVTFNEWMKKGEAGKAPYADFVDAVKLAEGEAVARWLGMIEDAAVAGTWQAAAWKLERRYPETYGRQEQRIKHEGEVTLHVVDLDLAHAD